MILSRINGKAGSLSSALSDVSAMAGNIEQAALEDTKRRLIMSMNTTATLQVPPLKTAQTASNSASALSKVEDLGPFQLRDAPLGQSLPQQDSLKVPAKRGRPARGANTKRTKSEGTETPGTDSASVDDSKRTAAADTTPTMTKSGRQVQKPTQYFPPASSSTSSSQKRKQHQGKRTAEQALCKVCTRGLSPAKNQIVFCDGCNACWHQLCHEPQIDHDYVSDQSRSWFCHRCLAKKERSGARRKAADPKTADLRAAEHKTAVHPKVISWKDKSNEQVSRPSRPCSPN